MGKEIDMIYLMIIGASVIAIIAFEVLPKVTWLGEDWKHLRIEGQWDASKSRGRVAQKHWW